MRIGPSEIIFIILLVVLLFGSNKIPELARSIGKSLGEFKKGLKDINDKMNDIKKD
jgi:sec-independent protein translocase protein TatA